ncbi:unnamed protein product [Oncorhynchus mykiss]|uniref:Anoctamin n=1 Tax=Oncorhynchus mykiss TaxID=8022 RepID=A0A060YBP1_ONCMY|nr:unnamed protein product [Oncorhynchus mykiss]
MRKVVKPQYGGGTRRFSCEEDNIYENIESELCFFTSQRTFAAPESNGGELNTIPADAWHCERQSIIKYWLDNLRAKPGAVLHNIHFLEGQPIIPELVARGVICQVFPLHEQRILSQLMTSWVQAVCERQPLDDVCDYFGVKIGMYFAWLGFYTNSMLYPAVVGFLMWILAEADQTSQDICCVVFALFNVVWATLFLERWKRREAELAYMWGTLDTPAEPLEEPRRQFRGVKRCSPITGCEELYYPPWKRTMFRWMVSLPICLLCLCFVFLAMLVCLEMQLSQQEIASSDIFPKVMIIKHGPEFVMEIKELPSITRFIPKMLLAIVVTVCDEVYRKIAHWLNYMENYRLQSAYENNLIIKMVFFEFINSYLSLFYIGFYLKDMERLKETLATLLIFRQFLQNIKEVLQPYLYEHHKLGVFTPKSWIDPPDEPKSVILSQAEVESCMQTYEDTLQDYQEMFIQFGYVVLFSSAFPLAAMWALINNIIEIRSDALKLCTGLQRPFGQRVESIGQWQTAMEAMGLIAIMVNCYLIGQCGQLQRLFPWLSPEMVIISIVVLEHFAILLKYVIHVAIPDIPGWVADEMAKLEYRRREAFKKHERQAQQHSQQQLRRQLEEEELQRQEELQTEAQQESEYHKADKQHHHEKAQWKPVDKPKRPSSLLGNSNVMKLKQIFPQQGKFSSGTALSPQSPTGGEAKLAGFLSFKFRKSPELKKEPLSERSQSPNRTFSQGKLFSFSRSEGAVVCANGPQLSKPGDATPQTTPNSQPTRQDLNTTPSGELLPSSESERRETNKTI